jgi:hypothetical protein
VRDWLAIAAPQRTAIVLLVTRVMPARQTRLIAFPRSGRAGAAYNHGAMAYENLIERDEASLSSPSIGPPR